MNEIYFPAIQSAYHALLDSGANHNIMAPHIASQFTKQRFPISSTITLTTADGSPHKDGRITEAVSTLCRVGTRWTRQTFLVADLGQHDIFLGFPWFYAENPQINWQTGTLNGLAMDLAIDAEIGRAHV